MLQKRLVRIINRATFFAHTDELFFNSGILKIQDIYRLYVGLYMHGHQHDAIYIRNHPYNTRNRSDLRPIRSRLTITRKIQSLLLVQLYGTLSLVKLKILIIDSRQSFKFRYKRFLLSSYVQPQFIQN